MLPCAAGALTADRGGTLWSSAAYFQFAADAASPAAPTPSAAAAPTASPTSATIASDARFTVIVGISRAAARTAVRRCTEYHCLYALGAFR
mmetsp:Transcript_31322/g.81827  ORF Transcript_31322/g.81827 Transcript_31322/m.81827 type:complete len:91 (+) Transcript_31322:658-930(+)